MTVGFLHGQSYYEPEFRVRWTTWGTVSSRFREIEIAWDRLESVGHLAPFLAPANDRASAGAGARLAKWPASVKGNLLPDFPRACRPLSRPCSTTRPCRCFRRRSALEDHALLHPRQDHRRRPLALVRREEDRAPRVVDGGVDRAIVGERPVEIVGEADRRSVADRELHGDGRRDSSRDQRGPAAGQRGLGRRPPRAGPGGPRRWAGGPRGPPAPPPPSSAPPTAAPGGRRRASPARSRCA